jgi:microcystin-dependent protein
MGYAMDAGSLWAASQPLSPPGATPVWSFVDVLRGSAGPQGQPGVGLPGPQGQIGPSGLMGARGPQGPAGRSSFSQLSQAMRIPCVGDPPYTIHVTDTSWMLPGELIYIPGAGTFIVIGNPLDQYTVQIQNSGDPTNTACGTMIPAGTTISPANMRGPTGPQGVAGPNGPPGPQGVAGASVFSVLTQPLTVPAVGATVVAFVQDSTPFSAGQIVYVQGGEYFSVQSTNNANNSLTLVNQGYPGGAAQGTVFPAGNNVSATGPQGPQGPAGVQGPAGPQGLQGIAPSGAIMMYGALTPPNGWLLCDGSLKGVSAYPNLYSIISTTYNLPGDTDSTQFRLPNLLNRFPLGNGSSFPMATTGGEVNHALSAAENGAHHHNITAYQDSHTHGDNGHAHIVPSHGHGWNDNNHQHIVGQHGHGWNDSGHAQYIQAHGHGLNWYDPTHAHSLVGDDVIVAAGSNYQVTRGSSTQQLWGATNSVATNISASVANAAAFWSGGPNQAVGSVADAAAFWTSGENQVVGSVAAAAAFWAQTGYANLASVQPAVHANMDTQGSGTPHNNMPPYLTVAFIIKV